MTFGKVLRQLRQQRRVGIKQLAPELGINYTYISKLENNRATPSDKLIERIADYFGCDKNMLYIKADKVPMDAREAILHHPEETLKFLRILAQNAPQRRR